MAADTQDAADLVVRGVGIGDVLQHVAGEEEVEARVGVAEPAHVLVAHAVDGCAGRVLRAQVFAAGVVGERGQFAMHGAVRLGVADAQFGVALRQCAQ
jgi:hypothetical protein